MVGRLSPWLLYFICLVMPVTGNLMSGDGKPSGYFDLFSVPDLPKSASVGEFATVLHLAGQWAVCALVAPLIAAVVWHSVGRRDQPLSRMPPQHPHTALCRSYPDAAPALASTERN